MPRSLIILSAIAIAVTGITCQSLTPLSTPPPGVYLVRQIDEPLTIDGRLDEPAWQRASVFNRFFVFRPANGSFASPTVLRMLWDSEYLYLAYECEDEDIWSFSDQPDDSLWNGDVVEFFVKPFRDQTFYYEFVMAPNGALFDACYPSRGAGGANRFKTWDSGARIATTINGTDNNHRDDDQGYIVEIAIPWAAFREAGKPAIGTEWTFGAFRYDYSKLFQDPLLLKSFPGDAPHGFHSYEKYGEMRFVSQ
ncbi:MAG TPA: carbohydrate-binding family 9-like protein [Candidatus Hydrogenedentes bacterium]|mgnify:CR=1 FL=1|jgi:hypothetical protein|nr:carbohydrate-binding family 9-like protein [Candidatus Hydrogenedentota bacterium]HPK00271.1 carbohydrate-binding family 9-like protein [Candidatus Hydrogenedentota bacterium]